MSLEDLNKALATIQIVQGNDLPAGSQTSTRTDDEDWHYNRESLVAANQARDWFDVLRILVYLSNKDGHPDAYKAMAQAVWLVLKIPAPVTQVTILLYNLLVSLGPRHMASGPLASLGNLMARHRTPDHPERELALAQSQQMLRYVAMAYNLETPELFQEWVQQQRLDDPDHFLPIVLETLDALIQGDWWFDHQAVQEELLRENSAKS